MQFAALVPVEQVLQAVVVLRNENGDARRSDEWASRQSM